jgi:hypothetical protein
MKDFSRILECRHPWVKPQIPTLPRIKFHGKSGEAYWRDLRFPNVPLYEFSLSLPHPVAVTGMSKQ